MNKNYFYQNVEQPIYYHRITLISSIKIRSQRTFFRAEHQARYYFGFISVLKNLARPDDAHLYIMWTVPSFSRPWPCSGRIWRFLVFRFTHSILHELSSTLNCSSNTDVSTTYTFFVLVPLYHLILPQRLR